VKQNFIICIPVPKGRNLPNAVAHAALSIHRCECGRCSNVVLSLQGEMRNTPAESVELEQNLVLPIAALGFLAEAIREIMRDERLVQ
jgi:hypothetical protein